MSKLDKVQRAAQEQFDRQSTRYGQGHILADVSDLRAVLEMLPALPGKRALDVATGGGHTALHLASVGYEVTASDISASMLDRAREAAKQRKMTIETCQHPAESFPYKDGIVDLVTCRVAPHHFSDPAAFVRETGRVLRTGGAFVLIDGSIEDGHPEEEEWLHRIETLRDPSHHRLVSIGSWKRYCADAALEVRYAELVPFKQPDLDWYFETAGTPPEYRARILELIRDAPPAVRTFFQIGQEDGRIVWWWQRLSLMAVKA